jgi:transcriptional regulator with XRE-family HTH domain
VSVEPEEIGRRIKHAREQAGWTQLEFALHANVSPSSVQRWEAGKLPRVRELMRLADLLDVPAEQLVESEAEADAAVVERLDRIEEVLELLVARLGRGDAEAPSE